MCIIKPQDRTTNTRAKQNLGFSWCSEYSCIPFTTLRSQIKDKFKSMNVMLYNSPLSQKNSTVEAAFRSLKTVTQQYKHLSIVYLDCSYKNSVYKTIYDNLERHPCLLIVDKCTNRDKEAIESQKTLYTIQLTSHNCKTQHLVNFIVFIVKFWQRYGELPNLSLSSGNALQSAKLGVFAPAKSVINCNIYDYVEKRCILKKPIRDCVKYSCVRGLK